MGPQRGSQYDYGWPRPGTAWHGLARLGAALRGLARLGLGLASLLGGARRGLAWAAGVGWLVVCFVEVCCGLLWVLLVSFVGLLCFVRSARCPESLKRVHLSHSNGSRLSHSYAEPYGIRSYARLIDSKTGPPDVIVIRN